MTSKEKVLEIIEKYSDKYSFYQDSIRIKESNAFLIGKDDLKKYLFIVGELKILNQFDGEMIDNNQYSIKKTNLSYNNLIKIKSLFTDLWPVPCNKSKSFGTGDRLGLVTASHIKAFKDRGIFPILAQQSVREISRTQRKWNDVINNALGGYFETGVTFSFGSDVIILKTLK